VYTSDYNATETKLLPGADLDYGELDALIIESTYADEEHTPRKELEEKFVSEVTDVVEAGGTVLVPACWFQPSVLDAPKRLHVSLQTIILSTLL